MNIVTNNFGVTATENCRDGVSMLERAGADFTVEKRQLSFPLFTDGIGTDSVAIDAFVPVRSDTQQALSNKTVGDGYQILQNQEVVQLINAICEGHDLEYQYMTQIQHGAGLCVQIMSKDLNKALNVGNDKHEGRLTISNFHDGSGALRVHISMLRLFCTNVFPALKREFKEKKDHVSSYSIKHSKNMEERINSMVDCYRDAMGDLENTTRIMNLLSNKKCSDNEQKELFKRLMLADGKDEKDLSERAKTARNNKYLELRGLANQNQNHCGDLHGTWYSAIQPITDYASHGMRVRDTGRVSANESRFTSAHFGAGADFAQAGMEIAMEMAGIE
jgi:phage/plasmid-like protein (TIGR03299 family)